VTVPKIQTRKSGRRRGIILTQRGLEKLGQAKIQWEREQYLKRYTLESLSERTGLTPTTLSKIFRGSSPVDKRSIASCFSAFNLTLLPEDYCYGKPDENVLDKINLTEENKTNKNLQQQFKPALDNIYLHNSVSDNLDNYILNNSLNPSSLTIPGGQIPLNSTNYIERANIESLCYEAIQYPGTWIHIIAPKQMGKTSLMARILAYAQTQNYDRVSVNLNEADSEILESMERFAYWLCATVNKQLGFSKTIVELWHWDQRIGIKTNLSNYFEELILAQRDRPLLLAFDELNQLFNTPNLLNEFLRLLKIWSEKGKTNSHWHKLRLVTVCSSEFLKPSSLDNSLFNAGLIIQLPELNFTEAKSLSRIFGQEMTDLELQQLMALLGGHPYRLHSAFYHLQKGSITLKNLLENRELALTVYSEHLQQQWWILQSHPHLWVLFSEIVQSSSPIICQMELSFQLQQMGFVHLQGRKAFLTCELFRYFFRDRLP
jgi:transcriptional regulator with XRE-family HTH domain